MKKIIIIAAVLFFGLKSHAQSCPFPSYDSLKKYVNKYIRNSAQDAFTSLRLNTALLGIICFAENSSGGGGSDSALINLYGTIIDHVGTVRRIRIDTALGATNLRVKKVIDSLTTVNAALLATKASTTTTITVNGVTQDISTNRTYTVTDANLSTSDVTTNNATTSKHGFLPKLPGGTTNFLREDGTFAAPPGGGGSPGGSDQDIQYNNSGAFGGSSGRFKWDYGSNKMSIFSSSTANLNILDDQALKIIGNRLYLGDTTHDEPNFMEFGNPYGATVGNAVRMTMGWMGTEEMNFGINFHYRASTHRKYDDSRFATWIAYNTDYFLMQAQGIGYAWNDNAGSKVTWSIYNIKSGNRYVSSLANFNAINIVDASTSSYQNNDGRVVELRHASGSFSMGGMQRFAIPDSTYTDLGGSSDGAYKFNVFTNNFSGMGLRVLNSENNSNGIFTYFDKIKGASRTLTTGTIMGGFNSNTVGTAYFVSSAANNGGTFSIPDFRLTIQNTSGSDIERFTVLHDGKVGINQSTPLYSLDISGTDAIRLPHGTTAQRPSPANGLARINDDSVGTARFEISDASAWFNFSSSGGGGGGVPTLEQVLSQGGILSTDKNYRLNTKKITFNTTSTAGGLEISGAVPKLNLIDSVAGLTGSLTNTSGLLTLDGSTGMEIKLGKSTRTMDNSSPDPDYGVNLGTFNAFTTNPNGLAEPMRHYNNSGMGDQFDIYRNPIGYSFVVTNNGRALIGNTNTPTGNALLQVYDSVRVATVPDGTTNDPVLVWNETSKVFHKVSQSSIAGSATDLTYVQNAVDNRVNSNTGTDATLLPATSLLAGLLDTGRAKTIDSLRYKLLIDSVRFYISTDSVYQCIKPAGGVEACYFQYRLKMGGLPITETASDYDYLIVQKDSDTSLRRTTPSQFLFDVNILSGSYTPTLTNVTNVSGNTSSTTYWYRIGDMVTVFGIVGIDPTLTGATELGVSLPVASNLSALGQLAGVGSSDAISAQPITFTADATNNRAAIKFVAADITNQTYHFQFSYKIL